MDKRKDSDDDKEEEKEKHSKNQDKEAEDDEFKGADLEKLSKENTFIPTLFEDDNFDFVVSNPTLQGNHIVYNVKGIDRQGPWEGQRRFNQFFTLHEVLSQRWPGVPIPKIPPKKTIGHKEIQFIHERRFYLERFLRKCAKYDFIVNSEEFIMFARPNGEMEKLFKNLPKLPAGSQIERMQKVTEINQKMYDLADKERFNNILTEFTFFSKKVLPQLKIMKETIENFKGIKNNAIANNKALINLLDKYEELNLSCYLEQKPEKMVFGDTSNVQLKDQMQHLIENMKNPFDDMYYWCKGEIYDLQAMCDAVKGKEGIEAQQKKLESKKTHTQKDLENVNQGRKTVRTIFKGEKDTGGMLTAIESSEREIENLQTLAEIMTIYLGEQIIPQFKKDKLKIYQRLMQQFTIMEINNAHQTASFWSNVLSNPNVKTAIKTN